MYCNVERITHGATQKSMAGDVFLHEGFMHEGRPSCYTQSTVNRITIDDQNSTFHSKCRIPWFRWNKQIIEGNNHRELVSRCTWQLQPRLKTRGIIVLQVKNSVDVLSTTEYSVLCPVREFQPVLGQFSETLHPFPSCIPTFSLSPSLWKFWCKASFAVRTQRWFDGRKSRERLPIWLFQDHWLLFRLKTVTGIIRGPIWEHIPTYTFRRRSQMTFYCPIDEFYPLPNIKSWFNQ